MLKKKKKKERKKNYGLFHVLKKVLYTDVAVSVKLYMEWYLLCNINNGLQKYLTMLCTTCLHCTASRQTKKKNWRHFKTARVILDLSLTVDVR